MASILEANTPNCSSLISRSACDARRIGTASLDDCLRLRTTGSLVLALGAITVPIRHNAIDADKCHIGGLRR
jgi:hypothetical protein